MSTQEQTNSNRDNAKKSTGPKTADGKAISSQNAVKHGFFAKNDVISGEDPAAYEQHRADIYAEYAPLTTTESVLTQRIASLTWRLMRADRLQTTVINTLVAAQQKATHQSGIPKFNIAGMIKALRRKDADPDYPITDSEIIIAGLAHFKYEPFNSDPAVDEAMHAAANPPAGTHLCDAEIQLGTVIYNDFHGSAVIERLQGYEQKIETSLFKTIRQFQQLQETRTKAAAAQEKSDWQYLCAEAEERTKRRETEEYAKRHHPAPEPADAIPHQFSAVRLPNEELVRENEPNPRTGTACRAPITKNEPNSRTAGVSPASQSPNPQNEPNSQLTSISEITYNRSARAKTKRNEPSQTNLTNPDDHPGRRTNKQT